jgi:hypothetical protein
MTKQFNFQKNESYFQVFLRVSCFYITIKKGLTKTNQFSFWYIFLRVMRSEIQILSL